MKDELVNEYNYSEDKVVTDGNNQFLKQMCRLHGDHSRIQVNIQYPYR